MRTNRLVAFFILILGSSSAFCIPRDCTPGNNGNVAEKLDIGARCYASIANCNPGFKLTAFNGLVGCETNNTGQDWWDCKGKWIELNDFFLCIPSKCPR